MPVPRRIRPIMTIYQAAVQWTPWLRAECVPVYAELLEARTCVFYFAPSTLKISRRLRTVRVEYNVHMQQPQRLVE